MLDAKTILKDIPDKRQDKDTTSLKFKEQLINFLVMSGRIKLV